jgi:excisionase family DNA binding protein
MIAVPAFDRLAVGGSIRAMNVVSPDKEWLTVAEAAEQAGCSEGWIRHLLASGELEGWKSGERAWNVCVDAVAELRKTLTARSVGKRDSKPADAKRRKSR